MGVLKTISAMGLVLSLAVAPAAVYAQSQASKTGSGGVAAGQTAGGILGLSAGAVAAGIAVAVAIGVAVAAASSDDDDDVAAVATTATITN